MYLDYSLKTSEERVAYVNELIKTLPPYELTNRNKTYMADYILFVSEKNQTKLEKKEEYPIITKNREMTINKRQVSYEGIAESLENGEDGLHMLINNDKNQLLDNKEKITEADLENIPGMKQVMEQIKTFQELFMHAEGKRKYKLKNQIIESWKQAYSLKSAYKQMPNRHKGTQQTRSMSRAHIPEKITIETGKMPKVESPLSLLRADHVATLLKNYNKLKDETYDDVNLDMHWVLIDLEDLINRTLKPYPFLYALLILKVNGISNEAIRDAMAAKFNIVHNEQYYSTLWCKKIPKMLAEQAQKEWIIWYYSNVAYGEWKYCNKCGKWKPAHPAFFSKNTSADGFYSVCKDCRSIKKF